MIEFANRALRWLFEEHRHYLTHWFSVSWDNASLIALTVILAVIIGGKI